MELSLIATSTMGLESLVARELKTLGYSPRNSDAQVGRTIFSGDFTDLVRANIHLRTAGKILIRLTEFEVGSDFDVIFDAVDSIPWEDWMARDAAVTVEARSVRSTITSVPALQRTVKKGIVNRLAKVYHLARLPETGPRYGVEISLYKDHAVITLDSTGRGLHRRGYRLSNVAAPLRETLAAALIELSVWRPDRPLIDPFCGSGTIPIEAAMIARNIAPGLKREFDAQFWPTIDSQIWTAVREEASAAILPPLPEKIRGRDIDPKAVEFARSHARRAGVGSDILFETGDFRDLTDDRPFGCVIMNPPYGDRIGERDELRPLYESIPAVLSKLPTWSHFVITAWNDFETLIGQKATRRRKLYNGRIECTLFQFLGPKPPQSGVSPAENRRNPSETERKSSETLKKSPELPVTPEFIASPDEISASSTRSSEPDNFPSKEKENAVKNVTSAIPDTDLTVVSPSASGANPDVGKTDDNEFSTAESPTSERPSPSGTSPAFGGLDEYAEYQAVEFGRCLRNRARHLRNYPKRGITTYRLYERDFPEVPLVVDLYEGEFLHIAEFDRPDERTAWAHRLWLDKMAAVAGEILNVRPENIFLKRRLRQKGTAQYEKLGESGRFITAKEGGLSFRCNMTDYLDTGLFLDHRITRDLVRKEAAGKRFLNLFCYTGSFTCYAADGGAASTVSVDLSSRYLDWAEANMEMNGFFDRSRGGTGDHRYLRADVMTFLAEKENEERDKGASDNDNLFDLCVCDPPTFSNSKATDEDWDVRRRHVDLLRLLATRMSPGGVVYFSNNFRHFKLDEEGLADLYRIREISNRTVPDEFRNKHIHRCWRMMVEK